MNGAAAIARVEAKESPETTRFDPKLASPFIHKSVSEETRRAYSRVIREFFGFVGGASPDGVPVIASPRDDVPAPCVLQFQKQ